MEKKISILIPYYNGEAFFSKLLSSIKTAIEECSSNWCFEIITIIDSIDTEMNIIQGWLSIFEKCPNVSVKISKNERNLGVAVSRNIALDMITGSYVHLIDQDDELDKNFYSSLIPHLNEYNFILVNGLVKYSSNRFNSHKIYYVTPKMSLKSLLTNDYIRSPGQVIFSKDLIKNVRFPDTNVYKGTDDRFFWIKIFYYNSQFIKPFYFKKPYYIANIHNANFSADKLSMIKSSLENWDSILREVEFDRKYDKLIRLHIGSLEFACGKKQNWRFKMLSMAVRLIYFLELNKLIRFYFKRLS